MYCNICGSPVDDKDIFCRKCGNKLVAAPEEVVFNSSGYKLDTSDIDFGSAMREEGFFTGSKIEKQEAQAETKPYTLDTSEFVWDVHEFNKEERPKENVTVDWKLGRVIDLDEEEKRQVQAELDAQLQEEIAARKRAEAEAAEKAAREAEILARQAAAKAEREAAERAEAERRAWEEAAAAVNELIEQPEADARPATLEDIENDIAEENRDMKRDTARIEKFYTFNKKNEEFQKLLDKEYERIKSKNTEDDSFILEEEIKKQIEEEPETAEPTIVFEHIEKEEVPEVPAEESVEDEAQEAPVYEPFDPIAHLKRAEEERNAALNYGKGTEDVFNNDELIRKFDTMELEKDVLELKLEKERKKAEQQAAETVKNNPAENEDKTEEPVKAQEGWGTFSFLDELFGAPQNDETAAEETEVSEEISVENMEVTEIPEETEVIENPEEIIFEKEEIFETVEIEPAAEDAEETEAPAEDIAIAGAAAGGIAAGLDLLDEGKEKNDFYSKDHSAKEKKKGGVGRVLFVIVIILLIIELGVLGIKYLAPESSAADFVNEKMAQVVEFFMNDEDLPTSGDVNQDAEGENDAQQNQENDTDADAQINTTPADDKNEVIINQVSRNKNIANIKANDSLRFDASADYADSRIKNSETLTDNILYKDADGTIYYVDQEVIGTLIAFDSSWIDYVNTKDKAVFNLLKKDSNAYNNCAAFNKDVTKNFKLLEVGEIRASEKGYYVWAYEVIETTSGGKTTSDEFKWVYYMEADGGNMQIVDYFRF